MDHLRQDNTEDYSDEQLDDLNLELSQRLKSLDPEDDEYDFIVKSFSDEVSRR